jgi:hypothetical protein
MLRGKKKKEENVQPSIHSTYIRELVTMVGEYSEDDNW